MTRKDGMLQNSILKAPGCALLSCLNLYVIISLITY